MSMDCDADDDLVEQMGRDSSPGCRCSSAAAHAEPNDSASAGFTGEYASSTSVPAQESFNHAPALGPSQLVSLLGRKSDSPVTPRSSGQAQFRTRGQFNASLQYPSGCSQRRAEQTEQTAPEALPSSPPRQFLTRSSAPRSCSVASAEHAGPQFSSPLREPLSARASASTTASTQFRSPGAQSRYTGVSESPMMRTGSPAVPIGVRRRDLNIRMITTERSGCSHDVEVRC